MGNIFWANIVRSAHDFEVETFCFQVTAFHSELGFFRIILAMQLQTDLISFTGRFLARTRSALVSWRALKNQKWNTTENIIFESSVLKHVHYESCKGA